MPVILDIERRGLRARLFLALVYVLLTLGGLTMVYPFMITVASSFTSTYDYHRFAPVLRALYDRDDRFMRHVASHFEKFPTEIYPEGPKEWGVWASVARDHEGVRRFAAPCLAAGRDAVARRRWEQMAADYADFHLDYDIRDTVCWYDGRHVADYARQSFEARGRAADPARFVALSRGERADAALDLLNRTWSIRHLSFFDVSMVGPLKTPLHLAEWDYPVDDQRLDFYQEFKAAYRQMEFRAGGRRQWAAFRRDHGLGGAAPWPLAPGHPEWPLFKQFVGRESPMSQTVPYDLRSRWLRHFSQEATLRRLGFDANHAFGVGDYNRLAGTAYRSLDAIPFPAPEDAPAGLRAEWDRFVHESYPRRLMMIRVTPELQALYRRYVEASYPDVETYNRLTWSKLASFDDLRLAPYENTIRWRNFIPQVPLPNLELHSAEQAWQAHLLDRYGSVAGINAAYGWALSRIEEARVPIREAVAVTFWRHEWSYLFDDLLSNYRLVLRYLLVRDRALLNTAWLVLLSVLASLTVNPLAGYALSRFNLRSTEKILLFLLATMAFPAAVSAIPGFLLIRDLGLLNTFAALVLPTLASGMGIFILKGFFDSLPRELYEAATVDGAREWQILLYITLPMLTPILAVIALNAFIGAYNGWEWALIVCQKQSRWTLAVWMYQMSQQMGATPWSVMAGFVMVSIPTALVFLTCQKVILRGIVLPSMK
jgi:ABC-type glycerol-3-phosphate transport system permease component